MKLIQHDVGVRSKAARATAAVLCLLWFGAVAPAQAREQSVIAETTLGKLVGTYADSERGVEVYKGIPYAIPPVGVRRWQEAEPASAWEEPRLADRFGPDCMQSSTMGVLERPEQDFFYHPPSLVSEDCLYLNVWAPAKRAGAKLPVMVWIHGGGEVQGSGSWPLYDGARLARKGVVLVTVNYRLGIFGRFAHPELTAESANGASGTYDLSDLLESLRWVNRNIGAFGGDAGNVTIFGESSGSLYVSVLMTMPSAKGLFHRVIGQSGAALSGRLTSLERAEAAGSKFAASLGVKDVAGLRRMSAAQLHGEARASSYSLDLIVDGRLLPRDPCAAFLAGQQHDVPVLVGFNGDELYGYRPAFDPLADFASYVEYVRTSFAQMNYTNPAFAEGFLALLPERKWTPQLSVTMVRQFGIRGWQAVSWAEMMMRASSSSAYLYYFDHPPQGAKAAFHTAEISFVFDNEARAPRYSSNMPSLPPTRRDLELADAMSDYWVAFARTGVPAAEGQPSWKPYSSMTGRHYMEFSQGAAHAKEAFLSDALYRSTCEAGR